MSQSMLWFSQAYGLPLAQYELPFVDFLLERDVQLYIDPFAITSDTSDLGIACHNAVTSFFQSLLSSIRDGQRNQTQHLIRGKFREPGEIAFGVSKSAWRGRGSGPIQEQQIVEALVASHAMKTGLIRDIQELELHIEGIGPDKISDLVANIIKGLLARWSSEICQPLNIPVRPVGIGPYWREDTREWTSAIFNLPVHDDRPYILVPKRFVRKRNDLMNHEKFYRKYALDILQAELLTAGDSLVRTLKNGERVVRKKWIASDIRFELSKQFITTFIKEHPRSIERYRADLESQFAPVDPAVLTEKSSLDDPVIHRLVTDLRTLSSGRDTAAEYHALIFELLRFVFDYALGNWTKEYKIDMGLGRIDIIADNLGDSGFFTDAVQALNASSVPIECKNYSGNLGNNEFNQIDQRLGPTTSSLGFMVCREITSRVQTTSHVAFRWVRKKTLILVFDDADVHELVSMRLARDYKGIDLFIRRRARDVKHWSPNVS